MDDMNCVLDQNMKKSLAQVTGGLVALSGLLCGKSENESMRALRGILDAVRGNRPNNFPVDREEALLILDGVARWHLEQRGKTAPTPDSNAA